MTQNRVGTEGMGTDAADAAATAGAPDEALRLPCEAWHPSVFIQEELDERGWTLDHLATEMCGDDWGVDRLALDFYFEIGPENPNCYLGEKMSRQIGRAFGVSEKFFLKLESAWRAVKAAAEVAQRAASETSVSSKLE